MDSGLGSSISIGSIGRAASTISKSKWEEDSMGGETFSSGGEIGLGQQHGQWLEKGQCWMKRQSDRWGKEKTFLVRKSKRKKWIRYKGNRKGLGWWRL